MSSSPLISASPVAPKMPHEHHRLTVRGLSNTVVHGIDLELASGECVCLQGPSGAGKSRLVRAICDLDVSSGEILLDNRSRNDIPAPEWRRLAALLPAESIWWEDVVGAHFKGAPPYPPASLGLIPDILEQPLVRLSSGERQRLALLRVLALAPRFLLLDEPTSNLDSENRDRVESLLRRHMAEAGTGVLWITHDDQQARRMGDRILYMRDGRLV